MSRPVFGAIDIGTARISLLVCEMTERGTQVLGSAEAASRGLRKGMVVNIEEAAASIRSAVSAAEAATGRRVTSAAVGITGRHVAGMASSGVVGVQGRDVSAADRLRAIESARTVYMPSDREVLHVIPTGFSLDGRQGITDPVGMTGVRLESSVHIITADTSAVQNLTKACRQAGLEVREMVFGPLATAGAVLSREEREQGALLLDMGGGTTDIACFRDGALVSAAVLGIGGLHITNDLAVGLKISVDEAERIKVAEGIPNPASLETVTITLRDGGRHQVGASEILPIVLPRCEELFEKVREEAERFGISDRETCPVVLTGGAALLRNIAGFASEALGMPVRIGIPQGLPGMKAQQRTAAHAAVVGLAAYEAGLSERPVRQEEARQGFWKGMEEKMKRVFRYRNFMEIAQLKKKGVSHV